MCPYQGATRLRVTTKMGINRKEMIMNTLVQLNNVYLDPIDNRVYIVLLWNIVEGEILFQK